MVIGLVLSLLAPAPDTTLVVAGAEIPLVRVEPGVFERDVGRGQTQEVVLTSGYWLGKYEATWATWQEVMGWSDGRAQPHHPVRRVSWTEVDEFLRRPVHRGDLVQPIRGWSMRR